ncbi:MAG TPA: DUF624 domain-containing protein [Anaerolineae bacterium]
MVEKQQEMKGDTWRAGFSEIVEVASTFVLANLLWAVSSMFVVTIPAATAGLFAVFVPWVRGQSVEPLAAFFGGIRQHWRRATAVALVDLAIGAFVMLNLLILRQMGMGQILAALSLSLTVLVAALALAVNVYAWPLLILQDLPVRNVLQNAFKLVLAHPGWTALVLATAVVPLLLSLFLPQAVFLTVSFSTSALITTWGAWRVIRRYINEPEA